MGSMLLAMGNSPAQGPHHACLEDPETVSAIHSGYATAGARVATTNTFLVARENEPFASGILSKGMELARPHGPVSARLLAGEAYVQLEDMRAAQRLLAAAVASITGRPCPSPNTCSCSDPNSLVTK